MPLNSYVTLGRSGLCVSPFCLGAMTFGQDLPRIGASVEESEAVLAHYLEEGGNFMMESSLLCSPSTVSLRANTLVVSVNMTD
jgi:hypothetical protein